MGQRAPATRQEERITMTDEEEIDNFDKEEIDFCVMQMHIKSFKGYMDYSEQEIKKIGVPLALFILFDNGAAGIYNGNVTNRDEREGSEGSPRATIQHAVRQRLQSMIGSMSKAEGNEPEAGTPSGELQYIY